MEIGKKIQSLESGVTDGISRYLVSETRRRHRCDSGQASEFLYSSSSPKCSTQKQSSTICDFFSALTLGWPGYWKEEPSTTTSEFCYKLDTNQQHCSTNDWWVWIQVLRPTWHNMGHFGDVLPTNLLAQYWTKSNTTKAHIRYINYNT